MIKRGSARPLKCLWVSYLELHPLEIRELSVLVVVERAPDHLDPREAPLRKSCRRLETH